MIINKLLNIIRDIIARVTTGAITKRKISYLSNGYIFLIGILIVVFGLTNITEAGTCWIKKMDNGKCKELFSKNMSKEECCKNSQEFAYTINELSDMEYFFAMAIGDGHSCATCLDSCDNAKCSPGKRCVIRKGQPKCICAPICKASAKENRKHIKNKNQQNYHHQHQQDNINHNINNNNNNNRRNRLFNKNIRTNQQQNKLINFDNLNSPPNRELQNSLSKKINNNRKNINYQNNNNNNNDEIISISTIESSTTFRTFKKNNQRKLNLTKNNNNNNNKNRRTNSTRLIEKLVNTNYNNNNNHFNLHHIKDTELLDDIDNEHQNDDSHYKHNDKFIITANDELENRKNLFNSQNLGNLDNNNNNVKRKKKNMNIINSKNILLIQTSSSLDKNININHHQHENDNQLIEIEKKKHHIKNQHHKLQSINNNHNNRNNNHRQRKIKEQLTNTNHISLNGNLTSNLNMVNSRQHKDYHHQQQQHNYNHHQNNNNPNLNFQKQQKLNNIQMLNRNVSRQEKYYHHQKQQEDQQHNRRQQEQNKKQKQQQQLMTLDEKIRNGFFNHGFPNPEFDLTQQEHQLQIYHGGYANPVCGSDGRTYRTECQLKKRACRREITTLSVAYRGHCQTSCKSVQCVQNLTCVEDQYGIPHCIPCEINCPFDDDDNPINLIDPRKAVCGVDGRTYKSICEINRQVCLTGRSIAVAYHGLCKEESTCNNVHCGSRMICLTDLITHKPRCVSCSFKCPRKKRSQLQGDRYVDVKICGNNNHTYHSWCHMRRDSCNTEFYIDIKHIGACHKDSFPKNLMDPYAN